MSAAGLDRLSVHEYVRMDLPVDQFLRACARAGVGRVSLMHKNIEAFGVTATRRLLDELGLLVSGYSSVGGWASGVDMMGDPSSLAENIGRLDEAAEVGATTVTSTSGPLVGSKDLEGARRRVAEGLAELAPHAAARGLRIALEPLHPWFCPEGSVVCSLRSGLDLVEPCPAGVVGITLDIVHVWWDAELAHQVRRAGPRIFAVHLADFKGPYGPGILPRRLMGEGSIDLVGFRRMLEEVDYRGPIDVEIRNDRMHELAVDEVVSRIAASYRAFMA